MDLLFFPITNPLSPTPEVCEVPSITDGSTYPPSGYVVSAGTNVTLYCDGALQLEYKQENVVECAAKLPGCYQT